jgi:hypothetical protein
MTMRNEPRARRPPDGPRVRRIAIRGPIFGYAMAGLLGAAVPLLLSCGSSGAGLIPVQNAGPLQSDFESVAQAAENGNGSCPATETAILKTEHDFSELPSTVDRGLRDRLHEGITKLRSDALGLCKQPLAQTTATDTTPKTSTSTTTTPTTPTAPQTTTTPTTPTTTPTTPGSGGGTPAPGEPGSESDGGTGPGEPSPHGDGPQHGDGFPGGAGEGGGR